MPGRAAFAQAGARLVHVATVELVVAGDEDDRHRPAAKALEPGPAAVDVAGQDEQLGALRGFGTVRLGLEVQVGEQLQPHQGRAGAPWQCLNLRPLPHGQGSLRPTFGASWRTASTL